MQSFLMSLAKKKLQNCKLETLLHIRNDCNLYTVSTKRLN